MFIREPGYSPTRDEEPSAAAVPGIIREFIVVVAETI